MTNRIRNTTAQIIYRLWENDSPNKAALAALRNSKTLLSRNASKIWPLFLSTMDKKDLSQTGSLTIGEQAIFAALHCYALYQQGKTVNLNAAVDYKNDAKQDSGQNLFAALAYLRADESSRKAIDRRVQAVFESTNIASVTNSISHLVSILHSSSFQGKIDFAQLSQDLYYFQLSSENARRICLKWGQQYYSISTENENQEKGE